MLDWNICGGNSLENIADHSEEVETGYGYSLQTDKRTRHMYCGKERLLPNSIPSTIDT